MCLCVKYLARVCQCVDMNMRVLTCPCAGTSVCAQLQSLLMPRACLLQDLGRVTAHESHRGDRPMDTGEQRLRTDHNSHVHHFSTWCWKS